MLFRSQDTGLSHAQAINDRGQVIGISSIASGDVHGFLYEKGVMTDLGSLPGRNDSNAFGINNRGQVVGESDAGTNPYLPHAFLFEHGAMTDLGTLPGDNFSEGVGITGRGDIAGNSTLHAILWTRKK